VSDLDIAGSSYSAEHRLMDVDPAASHHCPRVGYVITVGRLQAFFNLVVGSRSQDTLETLEGRVTALDVVQGALLLSVPGVRRRVKGDFSHLLTPSLLEAINRQVRLLGIVERRGKQPAVIHVQRVEVPGVEEA
jgi:hypothetical protein